MKRLNAARTVWFKNLLCGALIGAGAILPGVSGGVLAVVFGVYRPFMELLTAPRYAFPRYRHILLPLGTGWIAGFWLFANGIAVAFSYSFTATVWLFAGLIAGTVPALFREAGQNGRSAADWTALLLSAPVMFFLLRLIQTARPMNAELDFFRCTLCGMLWGAGVVIPGFSASPVMMALGLYQPVMERLANLDIWTFAQCLPGMAFTVLLLARVMSWLLKTYRSTVSHGITGIIAASALAMLPAQNDSILISALCCAGGFGLAFFLERLNRLYAPEKN